jgi:hypothetical protein
MQGKACCTLDTAATPPRLLALQVVKCTPWGGALSGLERSSDNGTSGERGRVPEDVLHIWSLALDPFSPEPLRARTIA